MHSYSFKAISIP